MADLATELARIANMASLVTEKSKTFRGELYGPSGGGKSTIAAMMMRNLVDIRTGDRILHIDTSEGYVSWENHPGLSDGILTVPFTTLEDLNAIADGIRQKIAPWDKIKGVIFDEGNKMAEQDAIRVNRARQKGVYGTKLQETANIVTEGPDYMIALERWREMIFKMLDNRDIHVIICAHQAEKKDRQGNTVGITPMFSPKINQATKEYLHLVAHLVGTVTTDPTNPGTPVYRRTAQVHPTVMVDAKCRLGIKETAINADELPDRVYQWLTSGGTLESPPDDLKPEEVGIHETPTSGILGDLVDPTAAPENAVPNDDIQIDLTAI